MPVTYRYLNTSDTSAPVSRGEGRRFHLCAVSLLFGASLSWPASRSLFLYASVVSRGFLPFSTVCDVRSSVQRLRSAGSDALSDLRGIFTNQRKAFSVEKRHLLSALGTVVLIKTTIIQMIRKRIKAKLYNLFFYY